MYPLPARSVTYIRFSADTAATPNWLTGWPTSSATLSRRKLVGVELAGTAGQRALGLGRIRGRGRVPA